MGLLSGLAGFIGMYILVKANLRTAAAADPGGLRDAITVALRGGAVSGFLVVALSLLGATAIYYAYGSVNRPDLAPFLIVGFGFGASFGPSSPSWAEEFTPKRQTRAPNW